MRAEEELRGGCQANVLASKKKERRGGGGGANDDRETAGSLGASLLAGALARREHGEQVVESV